MEPEKFNEFKKFLRVEMPGLLEKFPNNDLKEFIQSNGGARAKRPETMSDKDWDWYRQTEMDWMIKNTLLSNEYFIVVGEGSTSIKAKDVISKTEIDKDSTMVVIKVGKERQVFNLVGSIDYINARLSKQVGNE